jgi:hypothetical protein
VPSRERRLLWRCVCVCGSGDARGEIGEQGEKVRACLPQRTANLAPGLAPAGARAPATVEAVSGLAVKPSRLTLERPKRRRALRLLPTSPASRVGWEVRLAGLARADGWIYCLHTLKRRVCGTQTRAAGHTGGRRRKKKRKHTRQHSPRPATSSSDQAHHVHRARPQQDGRRGRAWQ